ncbi:MAG: MFS transporter [Mycobacteriaceae bacterium]
MSNAVPPASARLPREIWVLVVAAFVVAIGFGIVAPALPAFARSFDVGVTAASVVISAFAFMRLAFAPVSGRLVQRLGEQPVYLIGLLIVALSTGACAFAQSYWQLLVFRGLGGIGSTMFTVAAVGLLVRIAPPAIRGRVTGLYATSFLLGSIAGPLVGGALLRFGLRVPFVIYAVALLVAATVVYTQLRGSEFTPKDSADQRPVMRLREAWTHPAYRSALASSFANGWAVIGVRIALIPLFVTEVLRSNANLAGVALSVFAVGNAVVLLPAGRLSDVWGRKRLVLSGLLITGSATIWLGFTTSTLTFLTATALAGVGSGMLNPPQQAAVADVVGSLRRGGPVFAGFQMASDVGAITGPVGAGLLAEHLSYSAAFGVTGAIALLAALLWLRAPETLPGRASPATLNL